MGRLLDKPLDVPLAEEITGLDPWAACRQLADLPHLLFLDSAAQDSHGRYSFVCADPAAWMTCNGELPQGQDPFLSLATRLGRFPIEHRDDLPPFQGGAAGLFGYDLNRLLERMPTPRYDDFAEPDASLGMRVGFYPWVLSFDHVKEKAWIVARHPKDLERVHRWLDRPAPSIPYRYESPTVIQSPQYAVHGLEGVSSNFDRATYRAAAQRAIDYIHAGDCFQINLAQRLQTLARSAPLALYARLRACNAAPFAGYFDAGDLHVMSASPERFLKVQDREVETRPIKGTRPRGKTPVEDRALADALRASPKDHAENVMIVDLLRNDLGRVCEYGSVRVESVCEIESYRYVHHLVSAVRGRLRPECGPADLLRAAFPGGSVTGAPKIRAMEIITELEQVARGPYCGSLGYLGFDGSMDTNLLIRTFVQQQGWLHFSVGGGLVADSDPDTEYAETWTKAEGMLRALAP